MLFCTAVQWADYILYSPFRIKFFLVVDHVLQFLKAFPKMSMKDIIYLNGILYIYMFWFVFKTLKQIQKIPLEPVHYNYVQKMK